MTNGFRSVLQALAETQGLRVTNKSSAVLSVYIDSAINLPAYVDPVVRVKVGQTTQETVRKVHTGQPVYEQEFIFLVPNPETDNIEFMVNIIVTLLSRRTCLHLLVLLLDYRSKNQY